MEALEFKEFIDVIIMICSRCPMAAAAMVIPFFCTLHYLNKVVLQDKTWAVQALYAGLVISVIVIASLTAIVAAGKL